jgi:uncharacterized protein YjbI with pentapeptide repeats
MEVDTVFESFRHEKRQYALRLGAFIGVVVMASSLVPGNAAGQEFAGFRYENGKCVNEAGEEGLNPGYVGECGELRAHDLREATLNTVDFSGADMHNVRARAAKLRDAVLVGANLRSAELEGADLRGADLTNARMDRANLRIADLSGAILFEVKLDRANFEGALLRDANLARSDLRRADFRGADLSYADLTRANLRGAMFNQSTVFPVDLPAQHAQSRGMVYRP